MSAVSIGLWAGMSVMAFYNGLIEQRINTAISSELSHIQIHNPEFLKENDINFYLPDGKKILQTVSKDQRTKIAAGRIKINGMIASPSGSAGISINGIMPNEENQLTHLKSKIIVGNYFNSLKKNEILISEKIRKKLKLGLKKKTILTFQDREGNLASSAFRVVGIYKTGNGPYDDGNVFVNSKDVELLSGLKDNFNEIAIVLKSNKLLNKSSLDFKKMFPDVCVQNWMEISPELGMIVSFGGQMVYIFMGIILLSLAFGIVNTMMMSVLERTYEIGMLMALGMTRLRIFTMIILETFFLILIGSPIGMLLALITIAITNHTGIVLKNLDEVYSSFGFKPIIYPELSWSQFQSIVILVVITAFLSSLLPARKAIKLKPAETLKK